jgi:DNA-directed RNA polymerase
MALPSEVRARKYDLQNLWEESLYEESINKYWNDYDFCPELGVPEQRLLDKCIRELASYYEDWIQRVVNNPRTPDWCILLVAIGPEKMADISVRCLIQSSFGARYFNDDKDKLPLTSAQHLAKEIANTAINLVRYQEAKSNNRQDWLKMDHYTKHWSDARIKSFAAKFTKIQRGDFSYHKKCDFGHHMIRILETTDVIQFVKKRIAVNGGFRDCLYVRFHPAIIQEIHQMHEELSLVYKLVYRPMIVPPVPHTMTASGGALNHWYRKPVVTRFASIHEWEDNDIDPYRNSSVPSENTIKQLNGMMATEWEINQPVYEVMKNLFESNSMVGNLPQFDMGGFAYQEPYPIDGSKADQAIWCAAREEAWTDWFRQEQKRTKMYLRMSLCKDMINHGVFFHNWTVDFRGRAYTVTELLSPQSGDFDRAIIRFANAKPQTEAGTYWLKVHLANLFDVDKVPFDQRVAWVDDNMDMLRAVYEDPYTTTDLWCSDKPKKNPSFQRLAAIFELFREDGMTQLPIQQDGSCNGSQHWAAIMRDPQLAKVVNIVQTGQPNDLYGVVADACTNYLEKNIDDHPLYGAFLDHWDGGIPRAVTKRPTMCDSYGLTLYGIRKYLRIEEHITKDWVEADQVAGALTEMSRVIDHGLKDALVEPNKGKDYLKEISRISGECADHLNWTTPSGFRVRHVYYQSIPRRSQAKLFNNKKLTFSELTDAMDARAAEMAVAPNFIHSLDAAHLCLVVCDMLDAGIKDFSMIHDSFGCHACDVPLMREIIVSRFVHVHRDNLLDKFRQETEEILGFELPPSPERGDLDIEQVRRADYLVG